MAQSKPHFDAVPGEQSVSRPPGTGEERSAASIGRLGQREREVLSVLRELHAATVQQVSERLSASLAYTTVMTTLDRLFRKGFLRREKKDRAFLYSMAVSAKDLEGLRASDLIRRYFAESDAQPEMLISCLVDAVHHYDTELLDQLESKIRTARASAAGPREGDEG